MATSAARYRGRWVLDASGRAGVLARRGLRTRERGIATLALVGRWTADRGHAPPDPGCTLIESYRDGWAWSVPTSPRTRCVTAMVDPRRTDLARKRGLDGMWRAELAKAARLGRRLEGGRLDGPRAGMSRVALRRNLAWRPGLLLVGDAGSFIDPLSSYGVKKALASAWLAAIVTHTALEDDAMAGPACELYDDREREVYRTYRALSVPFLEQAAAANDHPFWDARLDAARAAGGGLREPAAAAGASGMPEPGERSLAEDKAEAFLGSTEVRAAYETIRALPSVHLRPAAGLEIVSAPAVAGNRIALEPHLVSERLPAARATCATSISGSSWKWRRRSTGPRHLRGLQPARRPGAAPRLPRRPRPHRRSRLPGPSSTASTIRHSGLAFIRINKAAQSRVDVADLLKNEIKNLVQPVESPVVLLKFAPP